MGERDVFLFFYLIFYNTKSHIFSIPTILTKRGRILTIWKSLHTIPGFFTIIKGRRIHPERISK